jgi:probable rRNA maturation factor
MNNMTLQIFNQTNHDIHWMEEVLRTVFKEIEETNPMSIIVMKSDQVMHFNRIYRGLDKTTDVLTFPNDDVHLETLGDVFINYDKVLEQAHAYGHSKEREVAFLAVHGYLHIKGYDHHTEEEEKEMIDKQESILKKAGYVR